MTAAQDIVDYLLEIHFRDRVPPKPSFTDTDKETEFYQRDPFAAYSHALERGHHPRLWQAVKGSVYEPLYREKFKIGLN